MFGFLAGIATAISAMQTKFLKGKRRIQKRKQKRKEVVAEEKGRVTELESDKSKDTKLKAKIFLARLRTLLLQLISILISFIELLLVFLGAFWILVILAVVIVILIVMLMIFSIAETVTPNIPPVDVPPAETTTPGSGGRVQWSEQELAVRGINLSDTDKNYYKYIMLCRQVEEGIVKHGVSTITGDVDTEWYFLIGTLATENGGYLTVDDVLTGYKPEANGGGYGNMGLNHNNGLIAGELTKQQPTKTYPASYQQDYSTSHPDLVPLMREFIATYNDRCIPPFTETSVTAGYWPYAVLMSATHIQGYYSSMAKGGSFYTAAYDELTRWNLNDNKEWNAIFIARALACAAYHDGSVATSNLGPYLTFYAGVLNASKGAGESYSFDNYSVDWNNGNSFYNSVYGGGSGLNFSAMPDTPVSDVVPAKQIAVNGQKLNSSLWQYVYESATDEQKVWLQESWSHQRSVVSTQPFISGLYGLCSYWSGRYLVDSIKSQLVGVGSGNFVNEPGVGQLRYRKSDGSYITADEMLQSPAGYLPKVIASNASQGWTVDDIQSLFGYNGHLGMTKEEIETWHKSTITPDNMEPGLQWTQMGPGVNQGKNGTYTLGDITKCPGCHDPLSVKLRDYNWVAAGNNLGKDGCTVYAPAYVLGAVTGKVVSPVELAVAASYFNDIGDGYVLNSYYNICRAVNLYAWQGSVNSWENEELLKACLDSGGAVAIGVKKGYYGASSTGNGHWLVINGYTQTESGQTAYYFWNSIWWSNGGVEKAHPISDLKSANTRLRVALSANEFAGAAVSPIEEGGWAR